MIDALNRLGTSFEGHENRFFSLDVPPESNYQAVCDQLFAWEVGGALEYETCEERVPGSFDCPPELETVRQSRRRLSFSSFSTE